MKTNQVSRNTVISLSLVLLSVLASIGLILFVDVPTGALFFLGYWIIAAISSTFKNKRYSSPRVIA
ncbi:hypothetical protein [Nitrosomonas communis]|uniref:Uncharacterized protein n=1 Tax=Nitrosomonas communis TaxID=44574 RepID=A0A1H2ZGY1_9PROT|nr:hypothetical protein [Nitrosomonas communis]SDX16577.1 hypothetical protein SAMN05421882_10763 [Nitrosomonas communis]